MTEFTNTSLTTKSTLRCKPAHFAMLAAVALSSTAASHSQRHDFLKLCGADQCVLSATANFDFSQFECNSANTEPKALNHEQAGQVLEKLFTKEGLKPSRIERTGDQSILFQFLGETRACVDLYPSGELIVLIRKSGRDEIHELDFSDSDRAIQLLQDASLVS
jgi:hypothetical protein